MGLSHPKAKRLDLKVGPRVTALHYRGQNQSEFCSDNTRRNWGQMPSLYSPYWMGSGKSLPINMVALNFKSRNSFNCKNSCRKNRKDPKIIHFDFIFQMRP